MKRKVIQLAGKTLLVSLPKKWCLQNHIKKGQELELSLHDSTIIVSNKPIPTQTTATITLSKETFVKNEIAYLYQQGVDEIRVNYPNNPELYEELKERTQRLLGFEIVNQTKTSCTIKNISSPQEEAFDTIYRRTWHVLLDMANETFNAMNKKKRTNIISMEELIDKLTDFCKRILNKHPRPTQSYQYAIIRDLEKIGDYYARICTITKKPSQKTITYFTATNNFLAATQALTIKHSLDNIKTFLACKEQVRKAPTDTISHYLACINDILAELYGPALMLHT